MCFVLLFLLCMKFNNATMAIIASGHLFLINSMFLINEHRCTPFSYVHSHKLFAITFTLFIVLFITSPLTLGDCSSSTPPPSAISNVLNGTY